MDFGQAMGNLPAALGYALKQKFGGGDGSNVAPMGGAAATAPMSAQSMGASPGSTASMVDGKNRDAYLKYCEQTMVDGSTPMAYRDWLQTQGGAAGDGTQQMAPQQPAPGP